MNRPDAPFSPKAAARRLVREARTAALATIAAGTGAPFVSLVTVATAADGRPLMLLSDLAVHTRNLKADPRASLLFEDHSLGDPLTGSRVSVGGTVVRLDAPEAERRRFLARHPEAEGYASFRDFGFWRLDPGASHLVAGFGRIVDIAAEDLILDLAGAEAIVEAEADILDHLNSHHAEALALYATRLIGAPAGTWKAIGSDPEGLDLAAEIGGTIVTRRLTYPAAVQQGEQLRATMKLLAEQAREP